MMRSRHEWDRVVALPKHKFVTGATLLQLPFNELHKLVNVHISPVSRHLGFYY
jgi:hypothetical protein